MWLFPSPPRVATERGQTATVDVRDPEFSFLSAIRTGAVTVEREFLRCTAGENADFSFLRPPTTTRREASANGREQISHLGYGLAKR